MDIIISRKHSDESYNRTSHGFHPGIAKCNYWSKLSRACKPDVESGCSSNQFAHKFAISGQAGVAISMERTPLLTESVVRNARVYYWWARSCQTFQIRALEGASIKCGDAHALINNDNKYREVEC